MHMSAATFIMKPMFGRLGSWKHNWDPMWAIQAADGHALEKDDGSEYRGPYQQVWLDLCKAVGESLIRDAWLIMITNHFERNCHGNHGYPMGCLTPIGRAVHLLADSA